jgi:LysM repeat protein
MRAPFLIVILAMLAPSGAEAQRVIHRIRFGETLAGVSTHYYGGAEHAAILATVNGLDPKTPLHAGDRLRIPTAWVYTVTKSATLETLARQLLGDRRRWQALSVVNKVARRRKGIKAGTQLVVPFTLTHTVVPGDTYLDIARRYYGAGKLAGLIASYNFANSPKPAAGTQIEVPISHVRIEAGRLEELVNQRLLGVSALVEAEQRESLQEANALLRRGEYWGVPLRLVQLLARDQSDEHAAEVFKLLAIAYVAVDRSDLAERAFQEALLRRPALNLDPVTTSPKVLRAFVDAKAKRSGP